MGITSIEFSSTSIGTHPSKFRTKQFNSITNRKEEAVLSTLVLGYNVIFIDVDIAVIRDPLPMVRMNMIKAEKNNYITLS